MIRVRARRQEQLPRASRPATRGALVRIAGAAASALAVCTGGAARPPAPQPTTRAADLRPFEMHFNLPAAFYGGLWHLRGTPGRVVSRDTVFTMQNFDYDNRAQSGVATGDPRAEDPHNVLTADKITIVDKGPPSQRHALLEGHVHILHRAENQGAADPSGDPVGDILSHDVVLTCDQATYYYRTKIGSCTGNVLLTGEDVENKKPVKVTMTATRLEYEQKNNLYRAIGDVLIKDGTRIIKSPELTAVAVDNKGHRKVEKVDLAAPIDVSFTVDETEEEAPAAPVKAAGPGTLPAAAKIPAPGNRPAAAAGNNHSTVSAPPASDTNPPASSPTSTGKQP